MGRFCVPFLMNKYNMSFEQHMKPYINPPGNPEMDFYIKGTTKALNKYMEELEDIFGKRQYLVTGTTILPNSPPTPVPVLNNFGYFVPNHVRISESEVKAALWCGDPNMSFINLFTLFGSKMSLNFTRVSSSPKGVVELQSAVGTPYVCNSMGIVTMSSAHYAMYGAQLMAAIRALGTALTAEKFLQMESRYLQMAVKSTPPMPAFMIGKCLSNNGVVVNGVFTGTLEANFVAAT